MDKLVTVCIWWTTVCLH